MKYRIAVCDDEKVFANDIIEKIKSDNDNSEITVFYSGENILKSKAIPHKASSNKRKNMVK